MFLINLLLKKDEGGQKECLEGFADDDRLIESILLNYLKERFEFIPYRDRILKGFKNLYKDLSSIEQKVDENDYQKLLDKLTGFDIDTTSLKELGAKYYEYFCKWFTQQKKKFAKTLTYQQIN